MNPLFHVHKCTCHFALLRARNDLTKTFQLEDDLYLAFEKLNIFLKPIWQ